MCVHLFVFVVVSSLGLDVLCFLGFVLYWVFGLFLRKNLKLGGQREGEYLEGLGEGE